MRLMIFHTHKNMLLTTMLISIENINIPSEIMDLTEKDKA